MSRKEKKRLAKAGRLQLGIEKGLRIALIVITCVYLFMALSVYMFNYVSWRYTPVKYLCWPLPPPQSSIC